jgi:2'-5' RNA ligase
VSVGGLAQGIDWPVAAFSLVESRLEAAGARYHTLARFPLAGPAAG